VDIGSVEGESDSLESAALESDSLESAAIKEAPQSSQKRSLGVTVLLQAGQIEREVDIEESDKSGDKSGEN
jgi:hypothetical protein